MTICDKHGTQHLIVCKSCLKESGGGIVPRGLKEIIDHFAAELEHNEKWAELHYLADEPFAAQRRLDHCEKLRRWLEWLSLQQG